MCFDTSARTEVNRSSPGASLIQPSEFRRSSVAQVASQPDLPLIASSKFYRGIAAGRPVIFIGDAEGEIACEIARGECGVTVAVDDAVGLAKAVERLCDDRAACARMGVNARGMFEGEFSQVIAMGKWRAVLREVRGG